MDKVVVVSLHRTATQSTTDFLKDLGYNACHWGGYILGQEIVENYDLNPKDFKEKFYNILEEYDAISDCPFNIMYEYFDKKYDKCKFILITRDFASWALSVKKLYSVVKNNKFNLIDRMQYWEYLKNKPESIFDCSDDDLKYVYDNHIKNVKDYFKNKNNFFEIEMKNIGSGYEIAKFLNKENIFNDFKITFKNVDFVNKRISNLHS